MRVRRLEGVTFVALALAATGGCSSGTVEPYLDVWTGIGIETMALYKGSDGFWWQDGDLWSSNKVGIITVSANHLTAMGGMCGRADYGDCTATFSPPVVTISIPQFGLPPIVHHLERVAGGLQVRDDADAIIATVTPRSSGADVFDDAGNFIIRADWDVEDPHRLSVTVATGGLLGWTVGVVPPEIGALALGSRFGAPDHATVIAAALTWLR